MPDDGPKLSGTNSVSWSATIAVSVSPADAPSTVQRRFGDHGGVGRIARGEAQRLAACNFS
jgi:hypothetical protein